MKLHEYTESDDRFVLFMEYCNDADYFDKKIVEVSTHLIMVLSHSDYAIDCSNRGSKLDEKPLRIAHLSLKSLLRLEK